MACTHSLLRIASLWHSFQASVRCLSDWREDQHLGVDWTICAYEPLRNSLPGNKWLQHSIWKSLGVPWGRHQALAYRLDTPELHSGYFLTSWSSSTWNMFWTTNWWYCRCPIFSNPQGALYLNVSEIKLMQTRYWPVAETYRKYSIELPCGIFEFLVLLCLRIEIILKIVDRACASTCCLVCLDGKYSDIFACHVKARHRPGFESAVRVASDERIRHFFPRFVDFFPRCLWRCQLDVFPT